MNTRQKQCELWSDLILQYCKSKKIYFIEVDAAEKSPLFNNATIGRKCSREAIICFLDYMASQGKACWIDRKSPNKCLIYWKTPREWANIIFQWAIDNGFTDTVCTLWELQHGESTERTEIHGIDGDVLRKALQVLEEDHKAEIFRGSSADADGIKFFS
eukprot:GEZU01014825.1.p1 GENE.GEZU01014825.1~~GEZU01014825.1.p1  ORF type:complete len:159 (+),score=43.32 GEZU01014825.1:136-612(+)